MSCDLSLSSYLYPASPAIKITSALLIGAFNTEGIRPCGDHTRSSSQTKLTRWRIGLDDPIESLDGYGHDRCIESDGNNSGGGFVN